MSSKYFLGMGTGDGGYRGRFSVFIGVHEYREPSPVPTVHLLPMHSLLYKVHQCIRLTDIIPQICLGPVLWISSDKTYAGR